jgi:hypothetical protein
VVNLKKLDSADPVLGEEQITRIVDFDPLFFWQYHDVNVISSADYETALIASHYASILDAPLLFADDNKFQDQIKDIVNKHNIVVGNIDSRILDELEKRSRILEQLNVEDVQKKIIELTKPNNFILLNPEDQDDSCSIRSDTSANFMDYCGRTSLLSPILASTKKGMLMPVHENNPTNIDNEFKNQLENYGLTKMPNQYLTIMSTPGIIPIAKPLSVSIKYTDKSGYIRFKKLKMETSEELDNRLYGWWSAG